MLSPLPRRSGWAYCFAHSPSRISLPRKGRRVGLRIDLFEACSTFTRVTACTLALSPIRDTHSEGFSYFVTSIAAPAASGWSVCRVGLAPTGKRRLVTAHTLCGALLVTAILAGTIMMVGEFRERALSNSVRELENTVLLLTRHFDQQFEDSDTIAADVISKLAI